MFSLPPMFSLNSGSKPFLPENFPQPHYLFQGLIVTLLPCYCILLKRSTTGYTPLCVWSLQSWAYLTSMVSLVPASVWKAFLVCFVAIFQQPLMSQAVLGPVSRGKLSLLILPYRMTGSGTMGPSSLQRCQTAVELRLDLLVKLSGRIQSPRIPFDRQ